MKIYRRAAACTAHLRAISGVFLAFSKLLLMICLAVIMISYKKTFKANKSEFVSLYFQKSWEQMRLKIRKNLRTVSLNSKFTGSLKKKEYNYSILGNVGILSECHSPSSYELPCSESVIYTK